MKLVTLSNERPITTSEIVAEGTKRSHKSVIQLIRNHKKDLDEFGVVPFEMRKSKGRPLGYAVLNEPQVYFLLTLMRNTDVTVKFKKNLIKEFMRMKTVLLDLHKQRNTIEWSGTRQIGKQSRKETTDSIQSFIQYATIQGSKNAIRYYSNITKMENKALFILEQKYPNIREMLNVHQLTTLNTADIVVMDALKEGMEKELNYKDIYVLAKKRVENLAELIKPTVVINLDEVKVLN